MGCKLHEYLSLSLAEPPNKISINTHHTHEYFVLTLTTLLCPSKGILYLFYLQLVETYPSSQLKNIFLPLLSLLSLSQIIYGRCLSGKRIYVCITINELTNIYLVYGASLTSVVGRAGESRETNCPNFGWEILYVHEGKLFFLLWCFRSLFYHIFVWKSRDAVLTQMYGVEDSLNTMQRCSKSTN